MASPRIGRDPVLLDRRALHFNAEDDRIEVLLLDLVPSRSTPLPKGPAGGVTTSSAEYIAGEAKVETIIYDLLEGGVQKAWRLCLSNRRLTRRSAGIS